MTEAPRSLFSSQLGLRQRRHCRSAYPEVALSLRRYSMVRVAMLSFQTVSYFVANLLEIKKKKKSELLVCAFISYTQKLIVTMRAVCTLVREHMSFVSVSSRGSALYTVERGLATTLNELLRAAHSEGVVICAACSQVVSLPRTRPDQWCSSRACILDVSGRSSMNVGRLSRYRTSIARRYAIGVT